jgi:hypothetical protein
MKKNIFTQSVPALSLIFLLSACGGGGGDAAETTSTNAPVNDSVNAPPTAALFTAEVMTTPVSVSELSTAEINLTLKNPTGSVKTTASVSTGISASEQYSFDISNDGSRVNIIIGEIQQEDNIDVIITSIDDGGRKVLNTISFQVTNTSAEKLIEEINSYKDNMQRITDVIEEKALIKKFSIVARLFIDNFDADSEIDLLTRVDNAAKDILISQLNALATDTSSVDDYMSRTTTELELVEYKNSLIGDVAKFVMPINDIINPFIASLSQEADVFTLKGYELTNGLLSQLVGNKNLGNIVDGEWVFNQNYTYLSSIVFPENQTCTVE